MASGSKKLGRLEAVFHDLGTVERAKIGDLTRQMEGLRETQDAIFRELERPTSFHGPFMALLSGRIGRIEREIERLSREREATLKVYAAISAREKTARQLAIDARYVETRKVEQRDLEALLEFQQGAAQGRGKSKASL
jgi:hypothetical protein